jgi:hypothetical protein
MVLNGLACRINFIFRGVRFFFELCAACVTAGAAAWEGVLCKVASVTRKGYSASVVVTVLSYWVIYLFVECRARAIGQHVCMLLNTVF